MVSQEMAGSQFEAQSDEQPVSRPPALLVDAMLGKLAKWLRLAGYDAEFWRAGSDDELIAAARARAG